MVNEYYNNNNNISQNQKVEEKTQKKLLPMNKLILFIVSISEFFNSFTFYLKN